VWSRQYRSAIFYHNEEQRQQAATSKNRRRAASGLKIHTEIEPLSNFYMAEDYHQKYYLKRQTDIMREFRAMYPESRDFTNSTATARVNGYVGGNGTLDGLRKDIDQFGLSEGTRQKLLQHFGGRMN
jgi:peptide-methionine (S)-S-oxide reductase